MANVIILAIVAILMAMAIRYMVRHRGSSCAGCSGECGCSHCAAADKMVENLNKAVSEKK